CLGALEQGFKAHGREILGLDGCFMSGPFPGQILIAVGVEANNGIYSVAYAILEAENKASWQKGLIQAIAKVFQSAKHKLCVKHIHKNMKLRFRGGAYTDMLWKAAAASTLVDFNKKTNELKLYNSTAYDWLIKLVDGRDQPIITFLEYIEYLIKSIVVAHKVIAKTVGPPTPTVSVIFDALKRAAS
ncbi:hypothetical protein Tco_1549959, partial [Tanacetum coccineum]